MSPRAKTLTPDEAIAADAARIAAAIDRAVAADVKVAADFTVVLPARLFAIAWANVSLAAADDADSSPALYRTVLIERHGTDQVRLIATDTVLMLQSWVGPDSWLGDAPALDEVPDDSWLAGDPDGAATAFVRHVLKVTKDEEENDPFALKVTLRHSSLEDEAKPTLMPELQRMAVTLSVEDMRVQLPIIEAPFPSWRAAWPKPSRVAAVDRIAFNAEYLATFAKFKSIDTAHVTEWTFHTASGVALVNVRSTPRVQGLLVPIRQDST